MDRIINYPGQLLTDSDLLNDRKDDMIALAAILEMVFGQAGVVAGFSCSALSNTAIAGSAFAVSVSRGFMTAFAEVDANAYGSVGTDTARSIVKCGINLSAINIPLTNAAPSSGQAINYLISGTFSEADGTAELLPYVNVSNPAVPNSGPSNSGTPQNTIRQQSVNFTTTAGAAATIGSQTTPTAPAGYVPLFVVTVENGDTAVTSGRIALSPLAPTIPHALQNTAYVTGSSGLVFNVAPATTSTEAVPLGQANALFAALAGSATQVFNVATAADASEAVPLGQAETTFAAINGSASQVFNVENATTPTEAVALGQLAGYAPFNELVQYGGANATITGSATTNTCSYTFTPTRNSLIKVSANASNGGPITNFFLGGSGFGEAFASQAGNALSSGPQVWTTELLLTCTAGVAVTITFTLTVGAVITGCGFGFVAIAIPIS